MGASLDAAHIFVSREQARAICFVGQNKIERWIASGELPVYLLKRDGNKRPGRRLTVFRLADVLILRKNGARAAATSRQAQG